MEILEEMEIQRTFVLFVIYETQSCHIRRLCEILKSILA